MSPWRVFLLGTPRAITLGVPPTIVGHWAPGPKAPERWWDPKVRNLLTQHFSEIELVTHLSYISLVGH